MSSNFNISQENSSTPKRRRLGTGRLLRQISATNSSKCIYPKTGSPIARVALSNLNSDRCESPPLPCNQIEYLCDSASNSSTPCSPGVLESSIIKNMTNWESLLCKDNFSSTKQVQCEPIKENIKVETEDITDDMFESKLEVDSGQNHEEEQQLLTSRCEKHFRDTIEYTIDYMNQSVCELKDNEINDKGTLFETKDSFLLDIKESGIIMEEDNKKSDIQCGVNNGNNEFYGLPIITKSLFKNYRNIEKFYDWQEECLNLDSLKQRRNLIYALPTSGGKTLVAEVLMLREVLNRKRNVLFILPFVAIVQEKIWSLSPFALQLDFLVEEYAAGKGHLPPKKRRKKNSIYIATIEKGLALVRNLIELKRLDELGLVVVDELHLIGEPGRGATLEILLTTIICTNENIQIVGMSATIGNLPDLAKFLSAEVYTGSFRPVPLTEYVQRGNTLYRLINKPDGIELVPHEEFNSDVDSELAPCAADPDGLAARVWGGAPGPVLVFCPTQRNAENVAKLLCTLQPRSVRMERAAERAALVSMLGAEQAARSLQALAARGLGVHHAGLGGGERALLEQAFRAGTLSVLCCTSTLAAGVNLPARRVVVRAPRVGRAFITLASYRQMAGRAGRAGAACAGESIIICPERDWAALHAVLAGGVAGGRSVLHEPGALSGLALSCVALGVARSRRALCRVLRRTLLAAGDGSVDIKQICDDTLRSLLECGAIEVASVDAAENKADCYVYDDSELVVSTLGNAAIKGCLDLATARTLLADLQTASRGLVLAGPLHLLYVVTPHDAAGVRPDYRHYYTLYSNLNAEGVQTAKILGITEVHAIRMMTGKSITNVPERVLCRFYLALMLYDLWNQVPLPVVAEKFNVSRGLAQSILSSACALASGARRACAELSALWPFTALLAEMVPRLQTCAAPELAGLMDLPNVRKARALQLSKAGYKRVEDVARARVVDLCAAVTHLSRAAAQLLVSAARMVLIEKVENLRAEAEDVMEELKS